MGLATYPNKKPIKNYLWSEKIPAHWETIRLGFLIEMLVGNAFPSDKFEFEGGIRLVRGDNVTEGRLRWGDKQRCWPEVTKDIERYLLADGDVLIGMDGSKVGKNYAQVRLEDIPLLLVQRVARLRSSSRLYPSYLRYLIGSPFFLSWVEQRKTDPMVPHITAKDICNYRVCCPGYEEQKAIACFLDFKTTQIDTLIAKKQILLEKLAEKRTALISHAVTKGLDPQVEMKDSGVKWLGEIPAHWSPKRLRFCMTTNPSKGEIKLANDALVSFIPMEAVSEFGGLNLDAEKELGDISGGYTYFANNDVVVAKITPCFENGKGAIARGLKNGIAFGTTELHVMRSGEALLPDYLFHLTMSHPFRCIGESEMYGAGGQKRVPETFLKDFRVGLPSINEQQEIVAYINKVNQKLDLQMQKAIDVVARLVEYRSALITNAVTGKIDVRGFQLPSGNTAKENADA